MSDNNVRLCEERFALDADVLELYEGAFPASERQSVEHLKATLAAGRLLYHRTSNNDGDLLCFTLVTVADGFSFLSYMATDPVRRSSGIGSKHLSLLLEIIKQRFPQHTGLIFEIESTNPRAAVLDEAEKRNRQRRKQFYERAGARVICKEGLYVTPSLSDSSKEWEGELMAFEFGKPLCGDRLNDVIIEIYHRCYQLGPDHPMVKKVLEHFSPCTTPCNGPCSSDEAGEHSSCPCRHAEDTQDDDASSNDEPQSPAAGTSPDRAQPEASASEENKGCGCLLLLWWQWLMDLLFGRKRS